MRAHDQLVSELMDRPGVRNEVERIETEEGALRSTFPGQPRVFFEDVACDLSADLIVRREE
jgi:hypothetical protein